MGPYIKDSHLFKSKMTVKTLPPYLVTMLPSVYEPVCVRLTTPNATSPGVMKRIEPCTLPSKAEVNYHIKILDFEHRVRSAQLGISCIVYQSGQVSRKLEQQYECMHASISA